MFLPTKMKDSMSDTFNLLHPRFMSNCKNTSKLWNPFGVYRDGNLLTITFERIICV